MTCEYARYTTRPTLIEREVKKTVTVREPVTVNQDRFTITFTDLTPQQVALLHLLLTDDPIWVREMENALRNAYPVTCDTTNAQIWKNLRTAYTDLVASWRDLRAQVQKHNTVAHQALYHAWSAIFTLLRQ